MDLPGILAALALLMWLAYRGWSILLLAPALVAAGFSGERLPAVCGLTHRESYRDIVMVAIVGAILALLVVILLGSTFGSF